MLVHLAQTELALTTRARFALSQDTTRRSRSHRTTGWPSTTRPAPRRARAYVTLRQFNSRGVRHARTDRPDVHPSRVWRADRRLDHGPDGRA